MKTPEEIKKGLVHCKHCAPCLDCAYGDLRDTKYTCETALLSDALVYIQQLEAQVPKWISVEERLPDDEVPVLLLYKSGYRVIGYWCDDFAEWDDMGDCEISPPDYWMPLPEPPKEEGV